MLISTLIASAMFIGSTQSSHLPSEISQCGTQLCVLGVSAGTSLWSQVNRLSGSQHDTLFLKFQVIITTHNQTQISFLSPTYYGDSETDSTVPRIELTFSRADQSLLGDWLVRYGIPCAVNINPSLNQLNLSYPEFMLNVVMPKDGYLSTATIVDWAMFSRISCPALPANWSKRWYGFLNGPTYYRHK